MTWLVTGGAGYIGAHVVHALRSAGEPAVVLDNLATGLAARVPDDVPLVKADVRDAAEVTNAVRQYAVTGVIHLAARKDVAESVAEPLTYYRDNLNGLRTVLGAAAAHGARDVVFSSSAAVYAPTPSGRVDETSATAPSNAYGRTKLAGEWMLRDAAAASGLRFAALRYFNVAGAGAPNLADVGQTNLVPRLLRAAADGRPAQVYGLDHPTRDGSCIRDYVHVADIAAAHVAAAAALRAGRIDAETINIGRGTGVSVLEMVDAVRRTTGRPLPVEPAPARQGDPPSVVAAANRATEVLGWSASRDLDDIVGSAWAAVQHHS
ncbi:MAG TPA: UDP-glucose 4-epimerase GalE [Pilimelia sp.]|nr:UDP-glucose 4-epimerase GalE [Pilimelia sp.]